MTDLGIKRMIIAQALEAKMQGMIADNQDRMQNGCVNAYTFDNFSDLAYQIREVAFMTEYELEQYNKK